MRYAVQTMGDPYGQARVRASNSSGSKDLVIFPPIGWGATAAPVEQSTCSKIADSQAEVKVRAGRGEGARQLLRELAGFKKGQ